jgi:ornithine carbamoyltransferase
MNHFITISETSDKQLQAIVDTAHAMREARRAGRRHEQILADKSIAMVFEKPSLRTRLTFELAIVELGGHPVVFSGIEIGPRKRECPADIARVLGGMVHGIVARVFEHQTLIELAEHCSIPIVNALSDEAHPAQAISDILTLRDEFGSDLTGRTVAYVGDANNVAVSLARVTRRFGVRLVVACPPGYEFQPRLADSILGPDCRITHDPFEAVQAADAIYTDTWTSMGQEQEKAQRQAAFADYQVNSKLLAAAPEHAIVLHCLPAYRDLEITDEVLTGPQSRAFEQARNRLHCDTAVLAVLHRNG